MPIFHPTITAASYNAGDVTVDGSFPYNRNTGRTQVSLTGLATWIEPTANGAYSESQIVDTFAGLVDGTYDVRVITGDGQTSNTLVGEFEVAPSFGPPVIAEGWSAKSGLDGAAGIEIIGGFPDPDSTVTIGGEAATVTDYDISKITVTAPAHAAGLVDVVVTDTASQSDTAVGAFEYVAAPAITSIAPVLGSIDGGTVVGISGTFPDPESTVVIGDSLDVISYADDLITVMTLEGTAGDVDVVVTDSYGQSDTLTDGFEFFVPPPILSSASLSELILSVTGRHLGVVGVNTKLQYSVTGENDWVDCTSLDITGDIISGEIAGELVAGTYDVWMINNDEEESNIISLRIGGVGFFSPPSDRFFGKIRPAVLGTNLSPAPVGVFAQTDGYIEVFSQGSRITPTIKGGVPFECCFTKMLSTTATNVFFLYA